MKKKIINGLLFAVALVAATSSFVSCKDYEGDNYAELQEKYATLQEAFVAQVTAMRDYVLLTESGWTRSELATMTIKDRLTQLGIDCNAYTDEKFTDAKAYTDTKIGDLRTEIQNWTNTQLLNYYTKNEMDILLATKLQEAKDYADNVANTALADSKTYTDNSLTQYQNQWESVWKDDLLKAIQQAAVVEANSSKWNQAYDLVTEGKPDWDRIKNLVDEKSEAWQKATDLVEQMTKGAEDGFEVNGEKVTTLQDVINYFTSADSEFADEIEELKELTSQIIEAMQAEITGITIQAAYNPIFGSFAYPIDVQSNILAAYFGEVADGNFDFPVGDVNSADLWPGGSAAILTSELEAIGAPAYHVDADGILMNEGAGNAGKLYLTINPSNVTGIEEGKYFTLRTSDNQVSKVTLSALVPSTEQLKWGYQRANSANGFYVADAEIKKDDVKSIALSFNMKSVASEVEGMMQDWSKNSAADIAKLGLDIIQNMKVDAPRLGVQAQWNDPVSGWKNYVSKYDLAAFSVRPLGFHDFYNADYSPAIVKLHNQLVAKEKAISMELINQIKGLINVNIGLPASTGNIRTVGDQVFLDINTNVTIPSVDFSTNAKQTSITIKMGQLYPGFEADGVTLKALPAGTSYIPTENTNINVTIPSVTGSTAADQTPINYSLNITSLFNAIKNGIENALGGVNGVTGKIEGAVNKLINFENKVFGKIESVLKNPNRYLQPALIAQCEQLGYFYPSRAYLAPTQVKKGQKIMFYPTTLNGEVVTPAFKKYVAVCGAWDATNIENTKDARKLNTGVMNTILDGTTYNLQKPFEYTVNAEVGTVIEIIYECLGYDGKVAGKKYYIEVYE